ncbi:uncharacterized protein LOC122530007 isoform X2 [Frieseomelitta varia]|uniref:uncharacterized protein LOC122530007 isoform X2 n=1 Tax=Frieseomelitta varia TaxID=561572 RepID=UPI001CB69E5B|nr:uncharacterized protein LOC122530007 isoform X2 [Frieseomelitta varia]
MTDESQGKIENRSGKTNEKDPVTLDSICKEVILRDELFRRNWSRKYEQLSGDFFKKVLAEECKKEGFPADTFQYKPPDDAIKRSPILLKPSPSIPRTTSGRWYISPKQTIEPPVEPDEFRVRQQRFIFLG